MLTKHCFSCKENKTIDNFYLYNRGRKKIEYYPYCKKCVHIGRVEYTLKNKEKIRIASLKYNESHKKEKSEAHHKRYLKNHLKIKQRIREWQKSNPEKLHLYSSNRRARKRNAGILSTKIVQMVYEDNIKKYGTLTCYLCSHPIPFGKDHLEHKTPLSREGTNEYNNLGIACQHCNCSKNTKTEMEYKTERSLICQLGIAKYRDSL